MTKFAMNEEERKQQGEGLVFYVGPPKSGSKSFAWAMETLGFLAVHDHRNNERAVLEENWDYFRDNEEGHVVFVDGLSSFHQALLATFPRATFVAHIRSCEEIAWSHFRHGKQMLEDQGRKLDYWLNWGSLVKGIEIFYGSLLQHFVDTNKLSRLHVQRISEGWEPLCKRFNVPIPEVPYPHSNKAVTLDTALKFQSDLPPQVKRKTHEQHPS